MDLLDFLLWRYSCTYLYDLCVFKGAVIDSQAEKEKNRITTGTLTWENIENKAEYKTSGKGISYSTGAGVPLNALGLLSNMAPTVKDKAETTTKSAVSKGTITITDKENQTQDIEKLNRNTEDSLNKLKEIFDKTKVEEKQELIQIQADVDKNHKVINSSGTPRTADCIAVGIDIK